MDDLVARFAETFPTGAGYYYVLKSFRRPADGEKSVDMIRVEDTLEPDDFKNHLNGTIGLSLVPLEDGDRSRWGVIDVDIYPIDAKAILKRVRDLGIPLVAFGSKSGGLHLHLHLGEPVSAVEMREALARCAQALGLTEKCEVFPKQTRLEPGSYANGINLPLFGDTRPLLRLAGNELVELYGDEALSFLEDMTITDREEFDAIVAKLPPLAAGKRRKEPPKDRAEADRIEALNVETSLFFNGPPCLQLIEAGGKQGIGGRNDFLREAAVYYRYANPEADVVEVAGALSGANFKIMQVPLDTREVTAIAKGITKKGDDVGYRCSKEPLCSHCHKDICRGRQFGAFLRGASRPAWWSLLNQNRGGGVTGSPFNVDVVIQNHDLMVGTFARSTYDQNIYVLRPLPNSSRKDRTVPHVMDDTDFDDLRIWMNGELSIPVVEKEYIVNAVARAARQNSFHQLHDWLDELVWDGTERIDRFLPDYLATDNTEYTRGIGRKWLIGLVARAFQPGCQMDYCLVLEGAQGLLKSSALRVLAGNDEWFLDNLEDMKSKDSRLQLAGVWIVEMAELAAVVGTKSINAVKNFITTRNDKYRIPYDRTPSNVPRSCGFAATYNPVDLEQPAWMLDLTGNRRFWAATVRGMIEIEALKADREQLWAEAAHAYKAGEHWWFNVEDEERLVRPEQEQRQETNDYEELVVKMIFYKRYRSSDGGWTYTRRSEPEKSFTTIEVYEWMGVPFNSPRHRNQIGAAMKKVGFKKFEDKSYKVPHRPEDGEVKQVWHRLQGEPPEHTGKYTNGGAAHGAQGAAHPATPRGPQADQEDWDDFD